MLAPTGRLVVIENRDMSDNYLIDIQDADFLQQRCAQIVAARRMMLFQVVTCVACVICVMVLQALQALQTS